MLKDLMFTQDIIAVLDKFLENKRPPVEIRSKLDIAYRFENQSVIFYEIRPYCDNPNEIMHNDFAKTIFVKDKNIWKIFWMRVLQPRK